MAPGDREVLCWVKSPYLVFSKLEDIKGSFLPLSVPSFSFPPFLLFFLPSFSERRRKYSKPKILDALPKATCA